MASRKNGIHGLIGVVEYSFKTIVLSVKYMHVLFCVTIYLNFLQIVLLNLFLLVVPILPFLTHQKHLPVK